MELFIGIGGAWVVGMVGYALINGKKKVSKHRCNVRREVIGFKLVNSEMNAVTKKKK